MALNPYLTIVRGQAMLDSLVDDIDTAGPGTLKLYADLQPTNADTAIAAQVLLATLTFAGTAFGAASSADPTVATAGAIVDDTSADATDTLTFARWANGTPVTILDCTAGIGATFDLDFNTDQFVTGATVSISALTVTQNLN